MLPALLSLFACSGPDADTSSGGGVIDLRPSSFPAPPAGGLQFLSGEMEIPPYSEAQFCLMGTYEGPDVGVTSMATYQPDFGHHVVVLGTSYTTSEVPDGELFDCTAVESLDMLRTEPLFVPGGEDDGEGGSVVTLPEGMGVLMESGQRYILQSHYINTGPDTLLVQDAVNYGLLQEDEVTTWAATVAHSRVGMSLPPGQETTVAIDCEWEEPLSLFQLGSHMHEWGTSFSVDWAHAGGTERVYDIPDWDPEYRDDPIILDLAGDPIEVQPGDVFTTTCAWYNDTDEALEFPQEMCASFGMVFPKRDPITCWDF